MPPNFTDYHAKYFAHELTKRCSSQSVEKLAGALVDAQVDLNPHQVAAALFAFKSPLSKGAILADEVGLGKTIEAGILLSQKWAERKRQVLIIVPSSLRKQWNRELLEKFFLPSEILEARSFNQAIKQGQANPFNQDAIVICSYQFAANKSDFLTRVPWDLVVIDEAHRLRNVYKKQNKTARILRDALASTPKVLLTATPLQNSLMELYGLVSFIDEYTFGDQKSFRERYARLTTSDTFMELKKRLAPICQRTLRRQVLEYVKYTNRVPITQEFTPTKDEQVLYDKRPLMAESRGTQALFVLLRYILPVLETGGVAVIDEFETGLHSHVVKYVVELFYSKKTNPKGAQLIANFHTDYLLQSTLEKYQIVFTEKDPDTQSTEAWRLDKVKGVARNANNHYAKYHAGAYGGIPNFS